MAKWLINIPWRMLGVASISLLAVAGVVLLMGLVKKKDSENLCKSIQIVIEGKETFIDQSDIVGMINNDFGKVEGRPLNEIPVQRIETALKMLPYVTSADVHMDMDGVLKVVVGQRGILLRVINSAGQEFYVDNEGLKIPTTLKYVPHTIVANGNIKESFEEPLTPVKSKTVKDLVKLVKYVENNELWKNQIVQLFVNEQGDIEIVPRVGDQEIVIGDGENLEDKLLRIELFYKNILPKVGTEAYSKINVKYGDQIICERSDGWYLDSLQMEMEKSKIVR